MPVTSIGLPSSIDRAGHGAANAGDRLDQLGLAVAGDAGNADDLAGADVEGDVVDHGDAARILDRQVLAPTA